MMFSEEQKRNNKLPSGARRKAISISHERLVSIDFLQAGISLPVLVQPAVDSLDLITWAESNRALLDEQLATSGGVLFRGFSIQTASDFERLITALSGDLLEYTYRSTPRKRESGHIYTSTEYPADQSIPLHNEMSYARSWPMKIWFFCMEPARQGGETPIADSRKVFQRIPAHIKELFTRKGVMYVRNYSSRFDLPWQTVFQTTDKAALEQYCRRAGIEFAWLSEDHLQTRQVCQDAAFHPRTGEIVWFNQTHLFHIASQDEHVQASLLSTFGEQGLPRHAYYGDGSPIEASVIQEIQAAYELESIQFPWQKGDILMLDNMLVAHGRMPFVGPRKVLVGMAESFTNERFS
jgi:alpha-ketoglutarate-dependent taurine dioxygenase